MRAKVVKYIVFAMLFVSTSSAFSGLEEGIKALRNNDYSSALSEIKPLAEEGDPYAQYLIGEMYANGHGLEQDYATAVYWLEKSAEQGFADAQLRLGEIYSKGIGVPINYIEAIKWFEQAYNHVFDVDGIFREKAQEGMVYSILKLAENYKALENYEESAKLYSLAAMKHNNQDAQLQLGLMYFQGIGVERNLLEAKRLFEAAATQNNSDAQYYLGIIYLEGLGTDKDETTAAYWLSKSAEQNNGKAQLELGKLYEKGLGVPQNKLEALKLYRMAAEQGIDEASQLLQLEDRNNLLEEKNRSDSLLPPHGEFAQNLKNPLSLNKLHDLYDLKNFGYFGYSLLILYLIWLAYQYFKYSELQKFVKISKSNLEKLGRQIPEEIKTCVTKSKVGLFLALALLTIFIPAWEIKEYAAALVIYFFGAINIGYHFFRKGRLVLKLVSRVRNEDGFFDAEKILIDVGLIEDTTKLSTRVLMTLESEEEKRKKKLRQDEAERLFMGIMSCLEANKEAETFFLGTTYYFSKIGFIDVFSKEVIQKIDKGASEIKVKKLVKEISQSSVLDRASAYDLVIGYFKGGKAFIKNGEFVFITDDQLDDVDLCHCCGQVIVNRVPVDEFYLVFCSDECKNYYFRIISGESVTCETRDDELIKKGAEGYITVEAGNITARNHKLFAIGGQGHGYAAERANHYLDLLTGKDSQLVGDNYEKYGPDRIVDGKPIQTKYYKTASRSIGAAIDKSTGLYKYIDSSTGEPMPIEVPKDQFDRAVLEIKKRAEAGEIRYLTPEGEIRTVSPNEAEKLVKKGAITRNAAINITRFGTIEGLIFDATEGFVASLPIATISFLANYAKSYWSGNDHSQAFQTATLLASKDIFKTTGTLILVQQLNRLQFVQSISVPLPEGLNKYLARSLNIGQGQVKNYLRGVAVSNAVIIGASAIKDMYSVINLQMTGTQFFKNTAVTTASVVGGSAGALTGQIIGGMVGGIAGPVGAFLGGMVAGHLSARLAKRLLDEHIDDDQIIILRMAKYRLNLLADDYMLTPDDVQYIVDNVMKDALRFAPNKNGYIKMSNVLLSNAIKLYLERPRITLKDIESGYLQSIS